MRKTIKKYSLSALVLSLTIVMSGCGQSPVRNPFAGRSEPKLGELPPIQHHKGIAKVAWSTGTLAKQERFTKLIPYANNQMLYAADNHGKVVALNSKTGKKLWSTSTKKKFTAGPALVDNLLLLTTADALVVALDANNGKQVWESKVNSEVLAPPSGKDGIVLVHANDGSVSALDAKSGTKLWAVDQATPSLTLHFSSAPVVVGNRVLVGFSTGKLLALNLQTGAIEWERTISLPQGRSELQRMVDITADPLVSDDTVYAITYQGKMAAVNISTGNLLWDRDVSSYQNIAQTKDHLFVTDNAHNLWAINKQTGATHWKQSSLAERYITGPSIVSGLVAVADRGGYVHFLSAQNGHVVNRMHISGKIYQGPISVNNELIVNAYSGKVAAITVDGSA